MSDSATGVLIVGAGPTGVALATLLAQRGVGVCLVERHPDVYPLPRAVHLDGEVFRILHELGVGEEFADISRLTHGLQLVDPQHRVLARFERELDHTTGLPEANLFDQPELEQLLRKNLDRYDAVRLLSGLEAVGLEQDADGVTVTVRSADGADESRIRAAYVVGCDGANSLVRRTIGSAQKELGFEQRWLVVDLRSPADLDAWDGVHQVCDPRRAATYMRIGADRYRFEIRLLDGEGPADFATIGRLRGLLDPWIAQVRDEDLEILRATEYTFRARVAETWRDRRLLIAGDAAHLTPPFIGQGMCAGFRDAANLAWKLAAVLSGTADDRLLDSYQAERRPHATSLIRLAVAIGRAMTGGGLAASFARRAVLGLLQRVPAVAARVLEATSPPLTGPLVDKAVAGKAAGTLLPLVRIGTEGAFVDELLGTGLALVARGDAAAPAGGASLPCVRVPARSSAPGERVLGDWLDSIGADWACVRPDRTVLAVGRSGESLASALALLG